MLNKDKLLNHIQKDEDRELLTKVLNKVEATLKLHQAEKTDFLDPFRCCLAESILKGIPNINYKFAGGYPDAERQRILIFPDYFSWRDLPEGIVCLKIQGNFQFEKVSHRDFLGAVLALGLKREKIGDILVIEDGCQIFLDDELADYVVMNLNKIHRVSVKVQEIKSSEIEIPPEKVRIIETTVTSLRLDVVAGAGFGVSRTQIAKEFSGERLKLNWGVEPSPSYQVNVGDVISLRGKGRIKLNDIQGVTAKGRFKVTIKRFL